MLTSLQETILSTLAAFIKGTTYKAPKETDWEGLFKECEPQAVVLSCFQGLDVENIPSYAKKIWKNYSMRSLRSNIHISSQHAFVHQLMIKENISYVILKGTASAYYYEDPFMRAMGDVDFWVEDKDLQKARDILLKNGFEQEVIKHISHLLFHKEKMTLELHFRPAGLPSGKMGGIIEDYLSDIFEKRELVEIAGNEFYKPNDFHHGLIIIMHTYHHMLSEGIGLRHLCDWAMFIKHFENESFATVFKEKLERVGLWKFAQILSCISYKYLEIPYRNWMGEVDEILCEKVIEDIFVGGNFGQKDTNRTIQGMSISNRGKDGVKKRKLHQFVVSVNDMGKTQFPKLGKIPVLKHFCFVPIGVRHIVRVLLGKRKRLHFIGNIKNAEKRKKIYEQFHLFEADKK